MVWQYNIVYLSGDDKEDINTLNEVGLKGWELVKVEHATRMKINDKGTERWVKVIKARLKRRVK